MQRKFVLFAIMLMGFVGTDAQQGAGITGKVTDPDGALITGAQVSVRRGGITKNTVTDRDGSFTFEELRAGGYDLKVSAGGFAPYVRRIRLEDRVLAIAVAMEVGGSRLTVTAETGQQIELANVPQAVTVIDREMLSERSGSVLSQAAEEEVGLNVQKTSPTIGAIVVRGLTGKNVVNYIDGVRYTHSGQRGGINTFFNLNDESNLRSIEVLRGPNSAQYGSDSLGGTVNLLSRSAVYGPADPEFHAEFNSFFRSADRSAGGSAYFSYGTQKVGAYVNIFGRRVNTLRTAGGIDTHSSITRFLGLPSTILYDRNPDTEFSQYGGAFRLDYVPADDQQIAFYYQRGQQDDGKRFDQLVGGDGNLIADLRNLMLDFGYIRYVKQDLGFFDSGSFTVSYNSQREERVNQGGQGNPFADIRHFYERTTATGFSFFLDKQLPFRNSFLFGGDYYHEQINSPAFSVDPVTNTTTLARPRVPDEARFKSGGLYIQNGWEAIPEILRISGALRYSAATYKARAADSPLVGGQRLWQDDGLSVGDFSGRLGTVIRVAEGLRVALMYSRGFRYPSMTDLGTLGLTGDGFEVDYTSAINLGGTIGTTADAAAVTTGIPVSRQRSEFSNNFDVSMRWDNRWFDTELTVFRLDINDSIVKQSLILPQGSVGRLLGDQQIVDQRPNGVVFVALSSDPVLVRANYTDAKIFGAEYEFESQITRDFKFRGNFTYVRTEDKATGEPPNIEGGTPPPTGFLSLKYAPLESRYWIEAFSTLAARQDRLSTLDLGDRRTGGGRSRSQIASFFRRGACVRGLTNNPDGVCNSGDETILLATGETIVEVQDRVLGVGVNSAPLFRYLPGYGVFNLRGGVSVGERSQVFWAIENMFDRAYRNPSWGIDGAGRSFNVSYRFKF